MPRGRVERSLKRLEMETGAIQQERAKVARNKRLLPQLTDDVRKAQAALAATKRAIATGHRRVKYWESEKRGIGKMADVVKG